MKYFVLSTFFFVALIAFAFPAAAATPIKIAIIPGHDDASAGAVYKNLKEKDINLALAKELVALFKKDPAFSVALARSEDGYINTLTPFLLDRDGTREFIETHKKIVIAPTIENTFQESATTSPIYHAGAAPATALRLYAINRWLNEGNFDLAINIHFNDYPGHAWNTPGKYDGFSIYTADRMYKNGSTSIAVAKSIRIALEKFFPISNFPQESPGVVEDKDLIAIGVNNTLNASSMVIEYDYLYAPALQDNTVRAFALQTYAQQTYSGIKAYFTKTPAKPISFTFTKELAVSPTPQKDVYALQLTMGKDGAYPPESYTLHDCPISGTFGPCTEKAVKQFQKNHQIPQTGIVGPKTRAALNKISSAL